MIWSKMRKTLRSTLQLGHHLCIDERYIRAEKVSCFQPHSQAGAEDETEPMSANKLSQYFYEPCSNNFMFESCRGHNKTSINQFVLVSVIREAHQLFVRPVFFSSDRLHSSGPLKHRRFFIYPEHF